MDARKVPLEENSEKSKRTVKRKNSVEENVKLIDLQEKKSIGEEKFNLELPRKSSKDKVMSPRFFVKSASSEKQADNSNAPSNNTNYKKM